MLHSIPTEELGPFGPAMTQAVQACVHCGFCLAACPTYREMGQEMDTPRGRIVLMKQVLEGALSFEAAQPHVDRCLGCLACEPACPSGVHYRDLINPFRTLARSKLEPTATEKFRRALLTKLLPFPTRFRTAARLGIIGKRFPALIPQPIRPMLDLLPDKLPSQCEWPTINPAVPPRRARVALLTGCVQQVLAPDINSATIEVLTRNGVEVVMPNKQKCCGGLAWHCGDLARAQRFARSNLQAFHGDFDAIVTNAAGCGSTMQEYHLVLRGTELEAQADAFSKRIMDVSSFLDKLGLRLAPAPGALKRIAYQDACHLAHAQGVTNQPRNLLRSLPGIELLELPEPHLCCGSAGTYNLDQPEIAASLGRNKAQAILATGAEMVVSGNIGCIIQIRRRLKTLGSSIPVRHTMQVLRDAYLGSGL